MEQPGWLAEAWQHLSVHELPAARHNPEILSFYKDVGHAEIRRDEVPWCAAFVGACLERSGVRSTRSLLARSYLDWGERLPVPCWGAVVVLSRGSDPNAGHVGFYLGESGHAIVLLGGNQSNQVSVTAYDKSRVLGFCWPEAAVAEPNQATPQSGIDEPDADEVGVDEASVDEARLFADSLEHVLEMEGGFSDDPHDRGGPTNKGVTLAVFSRHTRRPINADSRDELIMDLKVITDRVASEIYRERYWSPSRAASMPPAVALMHFDASVNHGLAGGAALLQQAVRVKVDSEIGPVTLHAIQAIDPVTLIERYAALRRARYRRLPHFWRFGRGWLSRVSKTLERARAFNDTAAQFTLRKTSQSKKGSTLAQKNSTTGTKPWAQSLTIWGALITALSTVAPAFGPMIGLELTPDLVRQAGEQLVSVTQAIGGLVGTIMTIYGRARATTGISAKLVG